MPKARSSANSKAEVVEQVVEAEAAEVETVDEGLPLREALEVSLEQIKEKSGDEKTVSEVARGNDETKDDVGRKGAGDHVLEPAKPAYEPPAEWSKEEKDDFLASSPKAQEAALRLHKARNTKLEEIKRESAELQWVKDLAKEVTPFVKVRGGKEPTHAQLTKALEIVNRIESATNLPDIIEILKAKNLPVPAELEAALERLEEKNGAGVNSAVLQRLTALESTLAEGAKAQTENILQSAWTTFEQEQNAAGAAKYPDINQTDSGLKLASNIGSLVRGDTDFSRQFIAMVKERIPSASYSTLLEEAYRWCGGRVDDSVPAKTQATQTQIEKAKRAASAVPGRASMLGSGAVKRYSSYREAAQAALEELRERE